MTSLRKRIETCKASRKLAAQSLAETLERTKNHSELETKNMLQAELSKNKGLYESGWYAPPPGGIAVMFGLPPDYERTRFDSLRKEEFWPREDLLCTNETVASIYVSPVDRATGMIGDFGGAFYRGTDTKIRDYLARAFRASEKIAEYAAAGMKFSELYKQSEVILAAEGLRNHNAAYVNSQGANIGHTVPWSYGDPSKEDQEVIQSGDMTGVIKALATGRVFISAESDFIIPATSAITIEPLSMDPQDPSMPFAFYHFMIIFVEGEKTILGNFAPAFRAWGMDSYIISKY